MAHIKILRKCYLIWFLDCGRCSAGRPGSSSSRRSGSSGWRRGGCRRAWPLQSWLPLGCDALGPPHSVPGCVNGLGWVLCVPLKTIVATARVFSYFRNIESVFESMLMYWHALTPPRRAHAMVAGARAYDLLVRVLFKKNCARTRRRLNTHGAKYLSEIPSQKYSYFMLFGLDYQFVKCITLLVSSECLLVIAV